MPSETRVVRRALLAMLCFVSVACDEDASSSGAAPEARVNAVMASRKQTSFADLCDVAPSPSANARFAWPALKEATPAAPKRLRWVNVWATWCKPCTEELPLLARTMDTWKKQGHDVELSLISVDADSDAAKRFVGEQAGVPASLHIADASQATTWLTSTGLPSGSAIPVHLVVDQNERILCARTGGVTEDDLARFARVMSP